MSALDQITQGLFDYAGMFPPASLEFSEALEEAAKHPQVLRRPRLVSVDMVVKPEHLPLLSDKTMEAAGWTRGTCKIALVGVPDTQAEEQAKSVEAFNREHAQKETVRRIVSFEPATEFKATEELQKTRDSLVVVRDLLGPDIQVHLEPRWQAWDASLKVLLTLLSELPERHQIGLKVRCAGPTQVDRTTMIQILDALSKHKIPLKATQGLHHPLIEERWDNQWGFLNLITALRLIDTGQDLPQSRLEALLAEDDPGAYAFGEGLRWRDQEIPAEELQGSMERVPLSIGSCSLREPDDDLTRLFP